METATAPTQTQRIRHVTEQFNNFNRQIQFGSLAILITTSNIAPGWYREFLGNIFGQDNRMTGLLMEAAPFVIVILLGTIIATYFEHTYGKVVDKPKVKTGNLIKDNWEVSVILGFVIVFLVTTYIAMTVIKLNYAQWNVTDPVLQAIIVVFLVYKWRKSPMGSIWSAYLIAGFLLLLLTVWAAFSFDPVVFGNGGKFVALLYLNFYLFQLIYLVILVQTVKQTRQQSEAQIFLTSDVAIPSSSLQIIFTILDNCKSANTTYLRRFTGVDREKIDQILFYLQAQGIVELSPESSTASRSKPTARKPVRYNVSLTPDGMESGPADTSQITTQSTNF